VWVVGNARSAGNFSATVQLHTATANLAGLCLYAINYPPRGQYTANDKIQFNGTPDFTIWLAKAGQTMVGSTVTWTRIQAKTLYTVPAGSYVHSFTDVSLAPGKFSCKAPVVQTLTASASIYCKGSGVTLSLDGTERDAIYQLYCDGHALPAVTLTGNGNAMSFGNNFTTGLYRAEIIPGAYCATKMSGEPVITENPPLTLSITSPSSICYNATANLSATAGGGTTTPMTFTWSGAATGTSNSPDNISKYLKVSTDYSVIVKNEYGCTATVSGTIPVADQLTQPDPSSTTACYNTSVTLSPGPASGGVGGIMYNWQQNDDGGNAWFNPPGTSGNAEYTTPALTKSMYYQRVVYSICGTITSSTAKVTVKKGGECP
jgi:hypothetical protein